MDFTSSVKLLEEALYEAQAQKNLKRRLIKSPITGKRHLQRTVKRDLDKAKRWLGL